MTLQEKFDEYRNEGIEIGEARGIAKEKMEIAAKMLLYGLSTASICKYTGLSEDQILQLSKQ